MALTDSSRIFSTTVQDTESISQYCKQYFENKGYSVAVEPTLNGNFVSITKGGIFQSIAGMKTGLNINIDRMPQAISVSMKVGIFGKQAVPAAIAMLVFWPIIIPQIYGLIQQNKLDAEAYEVIGVAIKNCEKQINDNTENGNVSFCQFCGAKVPADAEFCTSCGKKMVDDVITCPSCKSEIAKTFSFCPKCGYSFDTSQ